MSGAQPVARLTLGEFLGNSLTQKQKFIRLYYLDCWIQIIQSDEQKKSSTKCYIPNNTV